MSTKERGRSRDYALVVRIWKRVFERWIEVRGQSEWIQVRGARIVPASIST